MYILHVSNANTCFVCCEGGMPCRWSKNDTLGVFIFLLKQPERLRLMRRRASVNQLFLFRSRPLSFISFFSVFILLRLLTPYPSSFLLSSSLVHFFHFFCSPLTCFLAFLIMINHLNHLCCKGTVFSISKMFSISIVFFLCHKNCI